MAGIGATRAFQPEPRRDKGTQEADPFLAFNSEAQAPEPIVSQPVAIAPPPPPLFVPPLNITQPRQVQVADPPYRLNPPVNLAPITIGLCIGLAGIATAGVLYFQLGRQQAANAQRPASPPPGLVQTHGTVTINSRPDGARVTVDGQLQGATPLTMTLPVGSHAIELENGGATRKIPLTIAGGETVSQMIELQPLELGYVSIRSPMNLKIVEQGKTLGTTSAGKISLPPGRHELELSSVAPEFRTRTTVFITPGQTAGLSVDLPQGSLSINATPWASVWVDGRPAGVTPLANLRVPIGSHEIVWKHPDLGERKKTVHVSARLPVRVGMDLRK